MIGKEFTKFSIHNHFGGTGADRCVNSFASYHFNLSDAIDLLDDAKRNDFTLLGFTNHNVFKKMDYLNTKSKAKERGIVLLPGVEIDLASDSNCPGNNRYLQTIVVFDEKSDLDFIENKIDEFINKNGNNFLTVKQLCELVVSNRCIVCPHGKKQGIRGAVPNPDQFLEIVGMFSLIPIFIENNRSYQKEYVIKKLSSQLNDFEYKVLDDYIASISAADRISFSDIVEPTYLWGDNSFDSLFYAAIIGASRILKETDFNEKLAVISKLVIKNDGGTLQDCEINFSEGLNTIIGPSGSGKTLLLNLIMNKLTGKNLTYSASSNKNVDYKDLYDGATCTFYDKDGGKIDIGQFLVFEGECLYKQIVDTYSKDKVELLNLFNVRIDTSDFDKYVSQFNSKMSEYISVKREMIRLKNTIDKNTELINTQISFLKVNSDNQPNKVAFESNDSYSQKIQEGNKYREELNKDISTFVNLRDETERILKKYGIESSYKELNDEVLKTLKLLYAKRLSSDYCDYSKLLINNEIKRIVSDYQKERGQKFKNIFEARGEISFIGSQCLTNLKEYFLNKSKLGACPTIDKKDIIKTVKTVENNYSKLDEIDVKTIFEYDDINKIFPASIGNSSELVNKSEFRLFFKNNDKLDFTDENQLNTFVEFFINIANDSNILNFSPPKNECIKYKIMMNIDAKNPEKFEDINKMSAGQLSKAYINRFLDDKLKGFGPNTLIVYDQPDNNLEKKFILEEIANKFKELKLKYQIFITTHEPLLVINGDSNKIILAKNEKNIEGNQKISFDDVSILDANDKKDAINKVSTLIDGSVDALSIRTQLYRGMEK